MLVVAGRLASSGIQQQNQWLLMLRTDEHADHQLLLQTRPRVSIPTSNNNVSYFYKLHVVCSM